jgi:transcription elongation factor GreA
MDDDSGFPTVLFMSRASHRALRNEIERVERELRTTIPRAIRKAREHGDLRENAEYDAAKLKQQQYNDRLAQLMARFEQAAVIEDAVEDGTVDGTEVHVGTEVTLTLLESGETLRYWVLGYDDSMHGTNVISFQAEIGRALWRRRVGDELAIPGADGERRVRVERIEVRVPPETTVVTGEPAAAAEPTAAAEPAAAAEPRDAGPGGGGAWEADGHGSAGPGATGPGVAPHGDVAASSDAAEVEPALDDAGAARRDD